jgi:hypothetical protein
MIIQRLSGSGSLFRELILILIKFFIFAEPNRTLLE